MADRLAMYEAQAIAIERQQEIERLTRINDEMTERLRILEREREERVDHYRNPVVNPVPQEQEDLPQREIDRLVGMNEEIAERLRIPEMEREERLDPNPNPVENPNRQEREEQEDLLQEVLNNPPRAWKDHKSVYLFAVLVVVLAYGLSVPNNNLNLPAKRAQQRENTSHEQRNTILVLKDTRNSDSADMTVFSGDRSKWLESQVQLPHPASKSGAVYLNEDIYIIGGFWNPKSVYKLDKNLTWIQRADLNIGRWGITNSCLAWNGYIWVFGGEDENGNCLQSVERYNPKEDKWELMRNVTLPRSKAAALIWNNQILISGGFHRTNDLTDTVECYNIEDDCQMKLPNMPNAEIGHSVIAYKEKLILLAGFGAHKNVWELNPHDTNPQWRTLPAMRYASFLFTGVILDRKIYAIGGYESGGKYLDRVEVFNGESWRDGPSLPFPVAGAPVLTIPQALADRLINYKV